MTNHAEVADDEAGKIRQRYEQNISLECLSKEFGYRRPVIRQLIIRAGGTIRPRGRRPLSPPSVLTEKLALLEEIVGESVRPLVLKTIVDYSLGHNDGRTFRKIDRMFGYEGALSQFRRDHLESSYYIMGRLWRAVYMAVTKKYVAFTEYGVSKEDVELCLSVLARPDKKKIRSWAAQNNPYMFLPNEAGVHKVVADCEKTINGIVNSKLRFIYMYDPAYERDDLVSFLRVVAFRVAIKYDWEMENGEYAFQKALNFTKRSLWNASYLLIKQNTSDDYRRLERVDTEERLYQTTTVSLDNSDPEWLSIEEKMGEPADTTCEVTDLVDKIGDPKLHDFLRLEYEEVPEFVQFVFKETGQEENDLYVNNYKKWRQLAMRFAGLAKRDDRVSFKRRIRKELGLWDEARIRRRPRRKKS